MPACSGRKVKENKKTKGLKQESPAFFIFFLIFYNLDFIARARFLFFVPLPQDVCTVFFFCLRRCSHGFLYNVLVFKGPVWNQRYPQWMERNRTRPACNGSTESTSRASSRSSFGSYRRCPCPECKRCSTAGSFVEDWDSSQQETGDLRDMRIKRVHAECLGFWFLHWIVRCFLHTCSFSPRMARKAIRFERRGPQKPSYVAPYIQD